MTFFSKRLMEETLIILKPDCMEKRIAGEVITRFENAGFDIVASKVTQLDGPILRELMKASISGKNGKSATWA